MHGRVHPKLSLLQLSCTLLPSSPLAYPTDSTILLLTSYLPINTMVSRQQSTRKLRTCNHFVGGWGLPTVATSRSPLYHLCFKLWVFKVFSCQATTIYGKRTCRGREHMYISMHLHADLNYYLYLVRGIS